MNPTGPTPSASPVASATTQPMSEAPAAQPTVAATTALPAVVDQPLPEGVIRPEWLGTRRLSVDADGRVIPQPTPDELVVRRIPTIDVLRERAETSTASVGVATGVAEPTRVSGSAYSDVAGEDAATDDFTSLKSVRATVSATRVTASPKGVGRRHTALRSIPVFGITLFSMPGVRIVEPAGRASVWVRLRA